MPDTNASIVTQLSDLFDAYGARDYGEHCTQYEHMAQCGWWADQRGCKEPLVLAAFLHDIGHLIAEDQALPERDRWGYRFHDSLGADWLEARGLPATVTNPIRLHVQAKRYLVATRPGYADGLSAASRVTLAQQGGPYDAAACRQFEAHPGSADAVVLRELDELGKSDDFELPPITVWLERLRRFVV
ncbi:phosphonate degradation HD-domain oxygenase [Marinobacter mangrovi]|uniref:phosphonate degradation HD-domain oxygenase n=1 Tax=Marinobacter mangrovi TaxID=2803918 RepID=UPI00193255AA|nr:phosphonate degradation HD-domain oxygenase [Marinobacter mangrovi]